MTKPAHLKPVPEARPTAPAIQRIELPTGGRSDVDGLLRELARFAFPRALAGFSFEADMRLGTRCHLLVAVSDQDAFERGQGAIAKTLHALGLISPKPAADRAEDGTPSPPEASPESPS